MPNPTTIALVRAQEASDRFAEELQLSRHLLESECGADAEFIASMERATACEACAAGYHEDPLGTAACPCRCHAVAVGSAA